MATHGIKALSVIRLSVRTDETTSPGRQRTANEESARGIGAEIIGEAEDLDVSASKTTPFERSQLGAWLADPASYDAILWWRLDRAVRSMADMHALARWARDHRKMLVFAEGPGGRLVLDFRNPLDIMSELLVTLLAFAAQMEAQAIKERVTSATAALRLMPLRWRGARPPYGYEPVPMPEGGGYTLALDPEAVAVVERIIRELVDGTAVSAIAVALNEEGIPSPRDHWALKRGRSTGGKTGGRHYDAGTEVERFRWGSSTIKALLTSPTLLGYKVHKGTPVRDAEGRPVVATDQPLLNREEYDYIGSLLKARATKPRTRKDTNALLLRVAFCDSCGGRLYYARASGKRPNIYGCRPFADGRTCSATANIKAEWLEEYVKEEFLARVGSWELVEVRTIPGYDPGPELAEVSAELEAHMAEAERFRSDAGRRIWQSTADSLEARLADLEATPARPPQEHVVRTGKTYADEWHRQDVIGRRRMLLDAGARVVVKPGRKGGRHRPDVARLSFTLGVSHAIATRLGEIAAEEAIT
ncbi:recombinase family protein [Streptomyces sp. NPDC039016]|uniref:recombinase family protein n=1 Tax=Streptomyces sp. NPDC039016 TaxID=3154330 RepID=UPI0033C6D832